MRQNTLPIDSQVCAQTPPDDAGVEYDDGDASVRVISYWGLLYGLEGNESR